MCSRRLELEPPAQSNTARGGKPRSLHMRIFNDSWQKVDPSATGWVHVSLLADLLHGAFLVWSVQLLGGFNRLVKAPSE
jgi:hypothetical protein